MGNVFLHQFYVNLELLALSFCKLYLPLEADLVTIESENGWKGP